MCVTDCSLSGFGAGNDDDGDLGFVTFFAFFLSVCESKLVITSAQDLTISQGAVQSDVGSWKQENIKQMQTYYLYEKKNIKKQTIFRIKNIKK